MRTLTEQMIKDYERNNPTSLHTIVIDVEGAEIAQDARIYAEERGIRFVVPEKEKPRLTTRYTILKSQRGKP